MEEMQQITLEQWLSWKEDIREKLRETAGNFVYIGFRLKQIRDSGMLDGAEDIFEFAQKEYGLGKSTVSRFIAINEKFSEGGNSLELRQEFKAIGSSKLAEMLTLTDAECQMITEKTTVKEIRELKSFSRQQVPEDTTGQHTPEGDGNGSQKAQEGTMGGEPLTPLQKCLTDFFRDKKEMLNAVIRAVSDGRFKDAAELMNPSGHCTHKKGLCFLFMEDYATGVKAKLLTEPAPQAMTWQEMLTELYKIFADIFESGAEDVHSAYYGGMAGSAAQKEEKSPKKRNAESPVATPQQEEKAEKSAIAQPEETQRPSKPEEIAAKDEKKEPEAAGVTEPAEEPLPGQMEIVDYPEAMPTVRYEEIPAEDSGADMASSAAGGDSSPLEDRAGRGQQDSGDDVEKPEGSSASVEQENLLHSEEKTEDLLFIEAEMHMQSLQKYLSVWDTSPMPQHFLRRAYDAAISIAAALERVMEKRGEWHG